MRKKVGIILILLMAMLHVLGGGVSAEKGDKAESTNGIRYIKGRKLSEEEIKEQKSFERRGGSKLSQQGMELNIQQSKLAEGMKSETAAASQYDARSKGLITPVKDQMSSNWCWDFATMSAMETSMIKNKVKVDGNVCTNKNIDLSEAAFAYYFYNRTVVNDPLKLATKDRNIYGSARESLYDYSGNAWMASLFATTGMGIKKEAYYPFDAVDEGKRPDASKAYSEQAAMVKNVYWVPNQVGQIKEAVSKYGSLIVSVNICDYNYDTAALYNTENYGTNHSVAIVGWDDNYSKYNFNECPGRNGAWIVKNSWSEYWGDRGYFYMSYEDQTMVAGCAIEMQQAGTYKNNYFYDGSAGLQCLSVPNNAMVAAEFTAKANGKNREELKAVQVAFQTSDVDYTVQVYKNVKNSKDPCSGTPALKKAVKGRTTFEGSYTISLNQEVVLDPGERYSVVITLKAVNDSEVFVGIESDVNYDWIRFDADNGNKQSFFKTGSNAGWNDARTYSESIGFRIKALTNNSNYKKVTFRAGSKVISTQYVRQGKDAKAPKAPKASKGYRFDKWDRAFTKVNNDLTVNAVFQPITYKLSFYSNGGSGTMKKQSLTYNKSTPINGVAFKRKGYTFLGWNTKSNGKGTWYSNKQKVKNLSATQGATIKLYARWSKNISLSTVKSYKRGKLTIKWSKTDSSQTGYQVCYSRDKKFKGAKKISIKGYKNLQVTIKKLSRNKKYYVRVRTYRSAGKATYYGAYTSTKSTKTK